MVVIHSCCSLSFSITCRARNRLTVWNKCLRPRFSTRACSIFSHTPRGHCLAAVCSGRIARDNVVQRIKLFGHKSSRSPNVRRLLEGGERQGRKVGGCACRLHLAQSSAAISRKRFRHLCVKNPQSSANI